MTSSNQRPSRYGRRFAWLAVFIVLLFGGYSAGWFYLAGEIENRARAEIATFTGQGRSAECVNLSVRGFPFRIGLWCDGVRIVDPTEGLEVSADRLRSAAQVYDPMQVIVELDSPANLAFPGIDEISADWEAFRASARLSFDFPERASIETKGLKASIDAGAASFGVDAGQAHMRRNGEDLDLALSFTGASAGLEILRGGTLPPLDGALDLTLEDGVRFVRHGARSLRGLAGTIRTLSIASGPDASMAVSGSFIVASDGLIDADLMLTVRDPKAISGILEDLFPGARDEIAQSLAGLQAFGQQAEVPLKIEAGRISLGFLPLGEVPPL